MNVSVKVSMRGRQSRNVFDNHRDTALKLFAEHGFKQVSMRDLAHSIGIKAGSLYYYIESKEQLLFEFLEEVYDALLLSSQKLHSASGLTPRERLRAFVVSHVQVYGAIPQHFQLLDRERGSLTGEYDATLAIYAEQYTAMVCETILPLMRNGCRVKGIAISLVGLLNSVPGCLFRSGFSREDVGRIMFDLVIEIIGFGAE